MEFHDDDDDLSVSRQGQSIRENVSAGVLIVGQGLVIRGVSRQQSGRYGCTAINAEGSGTSNAVQLKVMCKCHHITTRKLGVALFSVRNKIAFFFFLNNEFTTTN